MKKLLKLPLLLITLLLIFSCGRNAEADVNTIEDTFERFESLYEKARTIDGKEYLEEELGLFLEVEEIFSYYVNDANSDETLSFIRLLNESEVPWEMDDREDLKEMLSEIKDDAIDDVQRALNNY